MDLLIKINNQTAGRDKVARLLQYLSRFLWHRLQIGKRDGVQNIKNLEYQLSTFRKLLRFGRFVESLYTTLPLFQQEDKTLRYTILLSKITNSLFLLADHILWLGRADLYTVNTEKLARTSNKYWLYSIIMNLVRDFYEIIQIIKVYKYTILPTNGLNDINDILKVFVRFCLTLRNHQNVVVDTVKNGCDFFIPLTALGHVNFSPTTIGILGVISSIAGLLVILEPSNKLSP